MCVLRHSDIKAILPHRHPMLLVDTVTSLEDGVRITATKAITANEPCFVGLHGAVAADEYVYPSSLIIESFCQAAGILYAMMQTGQQRDGEVMLFGSISKFRFHGVAPVGEVMEHHVQVDKAFPDMAVFCGEVHVNGRNIANVERVVVALRPTGVLAAATAN